MKKLELNLPGSPEGVDVEVTYLGVFANGQSHDIEDEKANQWVLLTGNDWPNNGILIIPTPQPEPEPEPEPEVKKSEPIIVAKGTTSTVVLPEAEKKDEADS